jgi:hypothetical protein
MQKQFSVIVVITSLLGLCGNLNAHDFLWGSTKNSTFVSSPSVAVESSPYKIIPRPITNHLGKTLPYSSTVQASPAPALMAQPTKPYAYGWFGPQDTPQWQRHFGYHSRFTQWTLK